MNRNLILIVDDEAGQKTIRAALEHLPNIEILEANEERDSLAILQKHNIKLILTDGIDFVSTLRDSGIETPIIFVSNWADKNLAIKALRLKVFDFIERPFQNEILLAAVERSLVSQDSKVIPKLENLNLNLTQIKVLEMLMKGWSNKEIAAIVNLSEQGVKYHVGNLFKKFETSNRTTLRSKIWELIGA